MKLYKNYEQLISRLKLNSDGIKDILDKKNDEIHILLKKIESILGEKSDLDEDVKGILLQTKESLIYQQSDMRQCYDYMKQLFDSMDQLFRLGEETRKFEKDNERKTNIKFLEMQEEERKRVARELHDSTVQNLTGIIYKAEICDKLLSRDVTRVHLELQLMISSIKSIIEEMRNIIYDLRPEITQSYNIGEYIKKCIEEINVQNNAIHISLEVHGKEMKLDRVVFQAVLRVIGEALKNIVRHAEASSALVTITYNTSSLIINISDNGKGFETLEQYSRNKFGLSIMKERVELLGGDIKISSKENKGTSIWFEIPNAYSEDEE